MKFSALLIVCILAARTQLSTSEHRFKSLGYAPSPTPLDTTSLNSTKSHHRYHHFNLKQLLSHPSFMLDYSIFKPPLMHVPCTHVAAVMVAYNEEMFLEESIASAAYTLGEVVVIDHGSSDGSASIIARVRSRFPNVKTLKLSRSKFSLGMAKNRALSIASRPWIIRWDADFLAYNRSVMASLCKALKKPKSTKFHRVNFVIPRIDGDLHHVQPQTRAGSGPEPYVFLRGHLFFHRVGSFDDMPIPTNRDDTGTFLGSIAGSNNGAFMLHLGSLKPVDRVYTRLNMSAHARYMRDCIVSNHSALSMSAWLFLDAHGRLPRTALELSSFRTKLMSAHCARPRPLVSFDAARWPHTDFVLALLRPKLPLFFLASPGQTLPVPSPSHPSYESSTVSTPASTHDARGTRVSEAFFVAYQPGCPLPQGSSPEIDALKTIMALFATP